ncbi:MAG: hypothetical protein ABIA04_08365 [Pseudomonadota bacterium]
MKRKNYRNRQIFLNIFLNLILLIFLSSFANSTVLDVSKLVSFVDGQAIGSMYPDQGIKSSYLNFPISGPDSVVELRVYLDSEAQNNPEFIYLETSTNEESELLKSTLEKLFISSNAAQLSEAYTALINIFSGRFPKIRLKSSAVRISENGERYYSIIISPRFNQFAESSIVDSNGGLVTLRQPKSWHGENRTLTNFTLKFFDTSMTKGVGVMGFPVAYSRPVQDIKDATPLYDFDEITMNRLYLGQMSYEDAIPVLKKIIDASIASLSWTGNLLEQRGLDASVENLGLLISEYEAGLIELSEFPRSLQPFVENLGFERFFNLLNDIDMDTLTEDRAYDYLRIAYGDPLQPEELSFEETQRTRYVFSPKQEALYIPTFEEMAEMIVAEKARLGYDTVWLAPVRDYGVDSGFTTAPGIFKLKDAEGRQREVLWGPYNTTFPALIMRYNSSSNSASYLLGGDSSLQALFARFYAEGMTTVLDSPHLHHSSASMGYDLTGSEQFYRLVDIVLASLGYRRTAPHPLNLQNSSLIEVSSGREVSSYEVFYAKKPTIDSSGIIQEYFPGKDARPQNPGEIGNHPFTEAKPGNSEAMLWRNITAPDTRRQAVQLLYTLAEIDFLKRMTQGNIDQRLIIRMDVDFARLDHARPQDRPFARNLFNSLMAMFPKLIPAAELVGMHSPDEVREYARDTVLVQPNPMNPMLTGRFGEAFDERGVLSQPERIAEMVQAGVALSYGEYLRQAGTPVLVFDPSGKSNPMFVSHFLHDNCTSMPSQLGRNSLQVDRYGHRTVTFEHPNQVLGTWLYYAFGGNGIAMIFDGQLIASPNDPDWTISNESGQYEMPRYERYVDPMSYIPGDASEEEKVELRKQVAQNALLFNHSAVQLISFLQATKNYQVFQIKSLNSEGTLIGKVILVPGKGYAIHLLNLGPYTYPVELNLESNSHLGAFERTSLQRYYEEFGTKLARVKITEGEKAKARYFERDSDRILRVETLEPFETVILFSEGLLQDFKRNTGYQEPSSELAGFLACAGLFGGL